MKKWRCSCNVHDNPSGVVDVGLSKTMPSSKPLCDVSEQDTSPVSKSILLPNTSKVCKA